MRTLLTLDLVWLGVIMKDFYKPELGSLVRRNGDALAPNLPAAFGGVVYGVYDLTNLALVANWSVRTTVVDIAWGCFLCGTSSVAMRWLSMWLDGNA